MSLPYAPVSSLVSQISHTPSDGRRGRRVRGVEHEREAESERNGERAQVSERELTSLRQLLQHPPFARHKEHPFGKLRVLLATRPKAHGQKRSRRAPVRLGGAARLGRPVWEGTGPTAGNGGAEGHRETASRATDKFWFGGAGARLRASNAARDH